MKIVNTYPDLLAAYEDDIFRFQKWESYIDSTLPGVSSLLISDVQKCLETGKISWDRDYLPILNAVASNCELRGKANSSFCSVTKNLEQIIYDKFAKNLDVDIIFYLGLCNGAGWVTEYHERADLS